MAGRVSLSPNALTVLNERYLDRDENRRIVETPEQMFRRVAAAVARPDLLYDPDANIDATAQQFYDAMTSLEFLPNSPTLMNAGRYLGQLMACFVLPIEDNLESIFNTLKNAAIIQQGGGGTGFSFSHLRPRGDVIQSTKGVASGPVSFLTIYDCMTETMKMGSTRRGANMGILRVDHPDIFDFITAKSDTTKITNFNLSVAVTDDFMQRLADGGEFDLVHPVTGKTVRRVPARAIFDLMVEMAWRNGEPGVIFIDHINQHNPTPQLGRMEATNPCSEQPLLPYEACCLGSINLSKLVVWRDGLPEVDYGRLGKLVDMGVHFLDNVVDANKYPVAGTERMCKGNRKIGLGVMGFADMLIKLDIPYNSDQAVAKAGEVMRFLQERATEASVDLARRRGVFPNFTGSVYDRPGGPSVRNATLTTIAPTGTISLIANCSSGIEPIFALSYVRRILEGESLPAVHPLFKQVAVDRGFYSEALMEAIAAVGTIQGMPDPPDDVKRVFVTAPDIAPDWHVRIQAAFQQHTDNGVSKTANLPIEASMSDVRRIFLLAFQAGCKGVTVYRYGSRPAQVLSLSAHCLGCGDDSLPGTEVDVSWAA